VVKQFPTLHRTLKVYFSFQTNVPPDLIRRNLNPVIITPCIFKIVLILSFHLCLGLPDGHFHIFRPSNVILITFIAVRIHLPFLSVISFGNLIKFIHTVPFKGKCYIRNQAVCQIETRSIVTSELHRSKPVQTMCFMLFLSVNNA
jgi:hypothetical protein